MLKKTIPSKSKKIQPIQSGIKQAYELVAQDLFTKLKKASNGAKINLGDLGTFHKNRTKISNSFGKFSYYRISFKVSEKLRGKNLD